MTVGYFLGELRVLPIPPAARWEGGVAWSNDGTRLLAIRGYTGGLDDSRAAARPVDGNGTGIEIDYPGTIEAGCCSSWEWSPDDSLILGTPIDPSRRPLPQLLVDPVTGRAWSAPWGATSDPTWQRLAPRAELAERRVDPRRSASAYGLHRPAQELLAGQHRGRRRG